MYCVKYFDKVSNIKRYSTLMVLERVYIVVQSKRLAKFISWLLTDSWVEYIDLDEDVEFGEELANEFCDIYGIERTEQAWKDEL